MDKDLQQTESQPLESLSLDQLKTGSRIRIQTTQGSIIELFVVSAGGFSERGRWRNRCLVLNWDPKSQYHRPGAFVELIGEFKVNGLGFIHLIQDSPDAPTEGLKAFDGIEPSEPQIASMEGTNLLNPNILKKELLDAITVLKAGSTIDYKVMQKKMRDNVIAVLRNLSQTDNLRIEQFSEENLESRQETGIQGLLQMADLLIHHLINPSAKPWEGADETFEKAMQTVQKAIACYRSSNMMRGALAALDTNITLASSSSYNIHLKHFFGPGTITSLKLEKR